ncbi:hypothetical protein QVD17_40972 [Tagetes erecta]|uniref:LOB domain-containing protein n=1 Tax=Tagetes erecta TaxID=13708 RepID=A0AAD8JS16_TARER|nr:hypothetical protein QVD17_40972 [Tagetes erecta]
MSANPNTSHTSSNGSACINGPCGACKFLRRKCVAGCIFAPYFDSEHGATHFAAVHKVFGASNVSKLLLHIPVHKRLDAVVTICYEAQARVRDPVFGCVAHLFALQQQVTNLQAQVSCLKAHLETLEAPTPPPPPASRDEFPIANLPTTSCIPTSFDLSVLFDPTMQSSAWSMQSLAGQHVDSIQFSRVTTRTISQHDDNGDASDMHEVARELMQRHDTGSLEASAVPQHYN